MEENYIIKVNFSDFSNFEIEPTEKILNCSHCNKKFTDIETVNDHLSTHTHEHFQICNHCNKKFISKEILSEHLKSHQTNDDRTDDVNKNCFECAHCQQKFGFIDHLLKHTKVHFKGLRFGENDCEEEEESIHEDEQDEMNSLDTSNVKEEEEQIEKKNKKKRKSLKGIKRRKKKRIYMKKNVNKRKSIKSSKTIFKRKRGCKIKREKDSLVEVMENGFYVCQHCKASFDNIPQYKAHLHEHKNIKGHYTSVELVNYKKECTICGTLFTSIEKSLIDHVINTHPEINISRLCAFCGKIFPSRHDLERHIRCHTGEKPFICSECPYSCSRIDNLKKHFTVHTKSV